VRLEHLATWRWPTTCSQRSSRSPAGEGRIYGQGTATFTGLLSGSARWSNFPRTHGDFARPDAHGALEVDGGGSGPVQRHGLSNLTDGSGIHVMTSRTNHLELLWVNDVIALGEGSVDVRRQCLSMRYYSCHVDHRPDVTG
jgi:hypothetical protein